MKRNVSSELRLGFVEGVDSKAVLGFKDYVLSSFFHTNRFNFIRNG